MWYSLGPGDESIWIGETMKRDQTCPLCRVRISDWMIQSGKTTSILNHSVHNACLMDLALKKGNLTIHQIEEVVVGAITGG